MRTLIFKPSCAKSASHPTGCSAAAFCLHEFARVRPSPITARRNGLDGKGACSAMPSRVGGSRNRQNRRRHSGGGDLLLRRSRCARKDRNQFHIRCAFRQGRPGIDPRANGRPTATTNVVAWPTNAYAILILRLGLTTVAEHPALTRPTSALACGDRRGRASRAALLTPRSPRSPTREASRSRGSGNMSQGPVAVSRSSSNDVCARRALPRTVSAPPATLPPRTIQHPSLRPPAAQAKPLGTRVCPCTSRFSRSGRALVARVHHGPHGPDHHAQKPKPDWRRVSSIFEPAAGLCLPCCRNYHRKHGPSTRRTSGNSTTKPRYQSSMELRRSAHRTPFLKMAITRHKDLKSTCADRLRTPARIRAHGSNDTAPILVCPHPTRQVDGHRNGSHQAVQRLPVRPPIRRPSAVRALLAFRLGALG